MAQGPGGPAQHVGLSGAAAPLAAAFLRHPCCAVLRGVKAGEGGGYRVAETAGLTDPVTFGGRQSDLNQVRPTVTAAHPRIPSSHPVRCVQIFVALHQ